MADEQSRSERERTERQNEGYDEAAHGGPNLPPSDVGIPNPDDNLPKDEFDVAAEEARMEVRRREHSAD